jgi:hypothetical protein
MVSGSGRDQHRKGSVKGGFVKALWAERCIYLSLTGNDHCYLGDNNFDGALMEHHIIVINFPILP